MGTSTRSDRSSLAQSKTATMLKMNTESHTRPLEQQDILRIVQLRYESKSCKDCKAFVKVKFTGFCRAQNMKMVKEENICHRWQ